MKTAKKLFSLLLVAVLLFSALPFQAAAAGGPHTVAFKDSTGWLSSATIQVEDGQTIPVASMPTATVPSGQQFLGWSFADDGTVDADINTKAITGGTNVFAIYKAEAEKWNVAFKDAEGWMNDKTIQVQDGATIPAGSIPTPRVPTGKKHIGWSFSSTATSPEDITVKPIKAGTNVFAVYEIVHSHSYNSVVTSPTCEDAGYTTYTCACGDSYVDNRTPAAGHTWGEAVNVPATDTSAGSSTRTCTVCGAVDTDVLAQLTTTVEFVDLEGGRETQYREWKKGETITSLPPMNDLDGRNFIGWYTRNAGGGFKFDGGVWNPGNDNYATKYYARYEDSLSADYASVTVYAVVYNGNTQNVVKLTNQIPFSVGERVLAKLMANREYYINTFFDTYTQYPASDYEVADQAFYKDTAGTKVTDGTTLARGNTNVYIKIKAKGSAAVPVQLFVHTKVESGYVAHYDLTGFIAGDTVTDTYVKNFLKSKTGNTYNITAMYDQHDWDRMLAGFVCESNPFLEVSSTGLRIHVVAPSYTSSSTTTSKPASNPATGDNSMLEITAATMLLAAAAVVTLTQLRKRKMI